MIIGLVDITGKGHLTSQLCWMAGLFAHFSDKKHLIISRKPLKAEYYLGIEVEEAEKKRDDMLRLAVNGQLNYALIRDYSLSLRRGLDYLDASFIDKKPEFQQVLYEYLLTKATEGYQYIFVDLGGEIENQILVHKLILTLPQSPIEIALALKEKDFKFTSGKEPLLLFSPYFSAAKYNKKRLAKGISAQDSLGIEFDYDLWNAFASGDLLDMLDRKYLKWEKEYKYLARFIGRREES